MSRFVIGNLREGPEDLRVQLPVAETTLNVRTGADDKGYFYARLDEPIKHRIDIHFDTAFPAPRASSASWKCCGATPSQAARVNTS